MFVGNAVRFFERKVHFRERSPCSEVLRIDLRKVGKRKSLRQPFDKPAWSHVSNNYLEQFLNSPTEHIKIPIELALAFTDSVSILWNLSEMDIQIAKKIAVFPFLGSKIPDKWELTLTQEFIF